MPIAEQKTILDQIEIKRNGVVLVRLSKQMLVDGVLKSEGYHRCGVEPGGTIDVDTMCDMVNAHLVSMKEAPVEASEWDRVRRVVKMEHTRDVVKAYASFVESTKEKAT